MNIIELTEILLRISILVLILLFLGIEMLHFGSLTSQIKVLRKDLYNVHLKLDSLCDILVNSSNKKKK